MVEKKATDEQLIASYKRTKSVWDTAKEFGMCGQSVHERLTKLGIINKKNVFSDNDYKKLKEFYATHELKRGSGELEIIAKELGRTKQFISRKAKELGLTSMNRGETKERTEAKTKNLKAWFKTHEHPKGMLGKHHTAENIKKIKEAQRKYFDNRTDAEIHEIVKKTLETKQKKGSIRPRKNVTWKMGYRNIGKQKIYFRSRWEYNYALYLEYLKKNKTIKKWEYEPVIFWFEKIKRGCVSYKPDFKITRNDKTIYYIEIKGWMDAQSKTKLKRMAKYYPDVELLLVDAKAYKVFAKEWQSKLKGWEQ